MPNPIVNRKAGLIMSSGINHGPFTKTIQPSAAEGGLDTQIYALAPTTNYGTNTNLTIGENNSLVGAIMRTLIKFDLSSIPAGATVQSAMLSLYCITDISSSTGTWRVYRQKKDWVYNQVTWNVYSTGNSWTTAGGFDVADCEQSDIGNKAFAASETLNQYKDISLTPAKVQEWISGAIANNGMLIKSEAEANDMYAFSSCNAASNYPKLVVVYTI